VKAAALVGATIGFWTAVGALHEAMDLGGHDRVEPAVMVAPEPVPEVPSAQSGPISKSAVVRGMNAIRPRVSDCYQQYRVPGIAMVNVTIGRDGDVTRAITSGRFAGTPTGACVEEAVLSARFPPSDGLTTPYPFQLR
jgi:hypothetical protein